MSEKILIALAGAVLLVSAPSPRSQQLPPVRGQMPDLGRPTRGDDPLPLFNFNEYFTGKWTFEWDVPEAPLGPAGRIAGTTIYKPIDGGFFEATTEATGPAGPLKWTELIAYRKESKTLARHVTDSRGFSVFQIGPIGGDLGGYYNIYYESAPFVYDRKTIRIKTAMRLLSPINYKVTTTLSVDGGKFTSYGNPWWRKDVSGARSR